MNAHVRGSPLLEAGIASAALIADPKSWINRRVETVEMLSHEETRRRVSVDFTLDDETLRALKTPEGVVVPISVLTKEPRRNFDLRDESGRAVPVLGKEQNAELAQIALVSAAFRALPGAHHEEADRIAAELRDVVVRSPSEARAVLQRLHGLARGGDQWRQAVVEDSTCLSMLDALWQNYVLFAVLPVCGPNRRVLKYSYSDAFRAAPRRRARLRAARVVRRVSRPDRVEFVIDCPGAWRAESFHVEIVVPEELRIEFAELYDFKGDRQLSDADELVDRAALYAGGIVAEHSPGVFAVVTPERAGRVGLAAVTSLAVTGLLWLGVGSGLDAEAPGPAVSLLTAGAAIFAGLAAVQGEHRLVTRIFKATRLCLAVVMLAALASAAMLAMEVPDGAPVGQWRGAAIVASMASLRLVWAFVRAPG